MVTVVPLKMFVRNVIDDLSDILMNSCRFVDSSIVLHEVLGTVFALFVAREFRDIEDRRGEARLRGFSCEMSGLSDFLKLFLSIFTKTSLNDL